MWNTLKSHYVGQKNRASRKSPQSVWVHIGAPKTGTTLLQRQLLENPDMLGNYSIAYEGESYWLGVELAEKSPLPKKDLEKLRAKWQSLIKARNESVVILSCESFIGAPNNPWINCADVARDLAYILDGFDTRIVFCKRRLDQFYESLYHQFIKEGGSDPIEVYQQEHPPEKFEWDSLLGEFATLFGKEAVKVVSFENAMERPGSMVEYVFRGLGSDMHFEVETGSRDNPSYNERGLQLACLCNPHLDKAEKLKLREFLQTHFCKQPGEKFSVLSVTQRAKLRELDGMTDARLEENYRVD